jgi:hypothetical protein
MVQEFAVVVERDDEGYYVASVPALRGCHTQAKSVDDLIPPHPRGRRVVHATM